MIDEFIYFLEENLRKDLPGRAAQQKMSPTLRYTGDIYPDPRASIPSGVLILLFPEDNKWYTVLIERTSYGPHGGQIGLPGGKMEKGDLDIEETALRETREEIGIDIKKIRVLGKLTPLFVPHSNFCINPYIGYMNETPKLIREEKEVQSIITVSIPDLFKAENKSIMLINRSGYKIEAPFYNVKGHIVWGATAMILSEFESLINSHG